MKELLDHANLLLARAADDLLVAETFLARGQALRPVAFHAQQAAEKSIKALLTLENGDYPRTHDMEELLDTLGTRVPGVADMWEGLIPLSRFAVDTRYGEAPDPEPQDVAAAVSAARGVFGLAKKAVAESAKAAEADGEEQETGT